MFKFDLTVNIPLLLTILGSALAVVWKLHRVLIVLEMFPPHRHVGKQILFPDGRTQNAEDNEPQAIKAHA